MRPVYSSPATATLDSMMGVRSARVWPQEAAHTIEANAMEIILNAVIAPTIVCVARRDRVLGQLLLKSRSVEFYKYVSRSNREESSLMVPADDTWILGKFLDDSLQQQIASAEPDWLAY
jgi:hypothetical protein